MADINAYEYVFPLVGGESTSLQNGFKTTQICGTAFYLKGGIYLTAGHSLKNAWQQYELMGLAYLDNAKKFQTGRVTAWEAIDDYDIGFFKAETPEAKPMEWDFEQLPMLSDVRTTGFPYALDSQNRIIGIRSFKGYIVSGSLFYRFPSRPWCYELSFQCPRGLSGAPLFTNDFDPQEKRIVNKVRGIIIGNQSTEMLVYSDKEVLQGDKERIVERYEAMQAGIAIQTRSLQGIKSTIIGGSLLDYLRSVRLAK